MQKPARAKPKRKAETPTITEDLTGKFLRVGDKLYRTSDDKKPIVWMEPDRLVTSNIDALPDILRIAKGNGWTAINVSGGDKFKEAAFLAAVGQGLTVENYTPSKIVQAKADCLRARLAAREETRQRTKAVKTKPKAADERGRLKALSDRFLSQSHAGNARDPELRRAQKLVAETISITRAKYPDEPAKASKEVEARRHDVALRIAKGDKAAIIRVQDQQAQRARDVGQEQRMRREGRSC